MSFVDLALPNRPIAIAQRSLAFPAGFLFTVIILSGLFAFFAIWQGPGLWRDVQISQNRQVLPNADVLDGECSTRRGLTDCDARLVYEYNGQSYEKDVSVMFLDFSSGDYEVEVVISRSNPELATISLGLDMLWNRLAVFAVITLFALGGALSMLWAGWRVATDNRAAARPGRLTLVPLEVIDIRGRNVSYVDYLRNNKRRMTRTVFRPGEEPLMAVDGSGALMGIGVQAEQAGLPILLDKELARLDLTAAERQAALARLEAEQAERSATTQAIAPSTRPSAGRAALRGIMAMVGMLALIAIGVFGYWIYYATSAANAFDEIGIEINNLMPEPLNNWACSQLHERFGDERAPFGCVADDYTSWKVAPTGKSKI